MTDQALMGWVLAGTTRAILGEYQAGYGPQEGTTAAVAHSANAQGVEVDLSWVSSLDADETRLAGADGLFLAPGPPYLDLERALASIRSGIANGVPLIGTCSGFQLHWTPPQLRSITSSPTPTTSDLVCRSVVDHDADGPSTSIDHLGAERCLDERARR